MAEEPGNAAPQEASEGAGKSKKSMVLGGVIVGVMLLEGAGLYLGMKLFGAGPSDAPASEGLVNPDQSPDAAGVEVAVVKIRVPNRTTGKTYLYDIEVAATLNVPPGRPPEEFKKEVAKKLEERENAIRDRLSFLVRNAQLQHLDEPGLVMMRRQIKAELGKVLGDEKLFGQILLPRWTPLRADM